MRCCFLRRWLVIAALAALAFSMAVLAEGSQGQSQLQGLAGLRGVLQMRNNGLPNRLHRWALSVHMGGNSYGELLLSKPLPLSRGKAEGMAQAQDNGQKHSACFPEFPSFLPRPGARLDCSSLPVCSEHLA